jgi:ribosomal subunit interface protein
MEVEINNAEGVERSPALEDYVRQRVERLERRHGDRLTRVRVFLKDINAGKGGIDKVCTMEARPAGRDPVVVEAQDEDLYVAVRDAEGKLERALDHRLARDH